MENKVLQLHFHVFSVTDIPFFSCIPLLTVHLSITEWHTFLCLSKELHLHFHGDIHSSVLCYSGVKCAGSLPHIRNASTCNFNCKKSFYPLILLFLSCSLANRLGITGCFTTPNFYQRGQEAEPSLRHLGQVQTLPSSLFTQFLFSHNPH